MRVKIREVYHTISPVYPSVNYKNEYLKIKSEHRYLSFPVVVKPTKLAYKLITQIPVVKNYSKYTLFSSETIGHTFGCETSFAAPNYVFPSWDQDISVYSGITFGKIKINDFFSLEKTLLENETTPNSGLVC